MRCYKCGATLTASDRCPQCKADVSVYKRAAKASNAYYNLGLAKAKVRDLTGAAESLKTSVMIHKNNIEARNLLGLVYCEMGEVVEALSQWVISKNLQPDNNPAGLQTIHFSAEEYSLHFFVLENYIEYRLLLSKKRSQEIVNNTFSWLADTNVYVYNLSPLVRYANILVFISKEGK